MLALDEESLPAPSSFEITATFAAPEQDRGAAPPAPSNTPLGQHIWAHEVPAAGRQVPGECLNFPGLAPQARASNRARDVFRK